LGAERRRGEAWELRGGEERRGSLEHTVSMYVEESAGKSTGVFYLQESATMFLSTCI
jgi:hypothetical protein